MLTEVKKLLYCSNGKWWDGTKYIILAPLTGSNQAFHPGYWYVLIYKSCILASIEV